MAGKIFINYRRGDDPGYTQALFLRLEDEFGGDALFMDVEGHIRPGDDFVEVLGRQVAAADVLLAVIGPRWEQLLKVRENETDDFVVVEIKSALERHKRVIPVLVGGAPMPNGNSLPEPIRALARRNAVGLRPDRFKNDCQGLISALKEQLAAAALEREARTEAERHAGEAARLKAEAETAARAAQSESRVRAQSAQGLNPEEIRKAEELANWQFIEQRRSVDDLRDHLARFPGGVTERYALERLDGLVWEGIGRTTDVGKLQAYIDEFPNGAHVDAARQQLTTFERNAAEARQAEHRRMQETAEWGTVATSSDRSEIEAFLSKWPEGQHATAAKARLRELGGGNRRLVALVGAALLGLGIGVTFAGLTLIAYLAGLVITVLGWLIAVRVGVNSRMLLRAISVCLVILSGASCYYILVYVLYHTPIAKITIDSVPAAIAGSLVGWLISELNLAPHG